MTSNAREQVLLAASHACGSVLQRVRDEDGLPIVFALVAWPYSKPDQSDLISAMCHTDDVREQVVEALEQALRDVRSRAAKVLRPT